MLNFVQGLFFPEAKAGDRPAAGALEEKAQVPLVVRPLFIFWDYYNMPLPVDFQHCGVIAAHIEQRAAAAFPGGRFSDPHKELTYQPNTPPAYQLTEHHRHQLSQSRWQVQMVHKRGADDNMLRDNLLRHARNTPQGVFILIGSDSDFRGAVEEIHRNGTKILVFYDVSRLSDSFAQLVALMRCGHEFRWDEVSDWYQQTLRRLPPSPAVKPAPAAAHFPTTKPVYPTTTAPPGIKQHEVAHPESAARMVYFVKFYALENPDLAKTKFRQEFQTKPKKEVISWSAHSPVTEEAVWQFVQTDSVMRSARVVLEEQGRDEKTFGLATCSWPWADRRQIHTVRWSADHLLSTRAPCINSAISNSMRCGFSIEYETICGVRRYVVTVATAADRQGDDSPEQVAEWYKRTVLPVAQVWEMTDVQKAVLNLDETQQLLQQKYGVRLSFVFINQNLQAIKVPAPSVTGGSVWDAATVVNYTHKDKTCALKLKRGEEVNNVPFADVQHASTAVLASSFSVEARNYLEDAYTALCSNWLGISTCIEVDYKVPRSEFQTFCGQFFPKIWRFITRTFSVELEPTYKTSSAASAVAAAAAAPGRGGRGKGHFTPHGGRSGGARTSNRAPKPMGSPGRAQGRSPGTAARTGGEANGARFLIKLTVRGAPSGVQRCIDWLDSVKKDLVGEANNEIRNNEFVIRQILDVVKACHRGRAEEVLLAGKDSGGNTDVDTDADTLGDSNGEDGCSDGRDVMSEGEDSSLPRSQPLMKALYIKYELEHLPKGAAKLTLTTIAHSSARRLHDAFWARIGSLRRLRVETLNYTDGQEVQLVRDALANPKKLQEFKATYRLLRTTYKHDGKGMSVKLVGEKANIDAAKQQLQAIRQSLQQVECLIPCRSIFLMQLVPEEEFSRLIETIHAKSKNVQVLRSDGAAVSGVCLKGPAHEMANAERIATVARDRWLANIHSRRITLPRYEAQYLLAQELWTLAGRTVLVRDAANVDNGTGAGASGLSVYAVATSLDDTIVLEAVRAPVDALRSVNVLVNPANPMLRHAGGLAQAISTLAGPQLQTECDSFIAQHGHLQVTEAHVTSAFDMRANGVEHIVHVTPPTFINGVSGEPQQLRQALRNGLEAADRLPVASISLGIPAIGTGIFHFPVQQTIQSIVHTVLLYLNEHKATTKINRIVFFDQDSDKSEMFAAELVAASGMTFAPQDVAEVLEVDYQWRYRDDQHLERHGVPNLQEALTLSQARYKDYDFNENMEIEHRYQTWLKSRRNDDSLLYGDAGGTKNGFKYRIVFNDEPEAHYQQNVDPKWQTKRRIVRVEVDPERHEFQAVQPVAARATQMLRIQIVPVHAASQQAVAESESDASSSTVEVASFGDLSASDLETEVHAFLASERGVVEIPLPGTHIVFDDHLILRATVWLDSETDGLVLSSTDLTRRAITIAGFPKKNVETQVAMLKHILQAEFAAVTEEDAKPPQMLPFVWHNEHNGGDGTAVLIEVQQDSDEWQQVLLNGRWQDTMADHQVTKIERVENRQLWDEYAHHRALMQKKQGRPWRELHAWAWHGTRDTDPIVVANTGVDFRYSDKGLWGRGAYTAHNASYSHNYTYRNTQDNTRQMFLVNLLRGVALDMGATQDQTLRKPPVGYDSVSGFTNGSVVHIVYETRQLYPAYLISYR